MHNFISTGVNIVQSSISTEIAAEDATQNEIQVPV